jgi:hypothetical protein
MVIQVQRRVQASNARARMILKAAVELDDIREILDGSALPECNDGDDVLEVLDVQSLFVGYWTSDLEGGPDRSGSDDSPWDYSDGVWDS